MVEEKFNESANIVIKYLISGPSIAESYFEIGGIINSQIFEEGKRGKIYESTNLVSKVTEDTIVLK